MDFEGIIDCIFINKDKYWKICDEDKEKNFFIINKKFSRRYPKIAQLFNDKNVDKSSAMDRWYLFFKDTKGIPQWYWGNKIKNKKISYIPDNDINEIKKRLYLKDEDIKFLYKYYKDDLNKYIKKIKKYY